MRPLGSRLADPAMVAYTLAQSLGQTVAAILWRLDSRNSHGQFFLVHQLAYLSQS